MSIPMPSTEEKKRAIGAIISRGLPSKKSFFPEAFGLVRYFGLKYIFWGIGDCILTAFVFAAVCLVLWGAALINLSFPHFALFMITPVFYIAANLLSVWKDDVLGVLEVKRACKYTPEHLMVFRMLALCMMNLLLIIPPVAVVSNSMEDVVLLRLLLVSLSSLFLYSLCMAAMLVKSAKPASVSVFPLAWMLAFGVLRAVLDFRVEDILVGTSLFALAGCTVLSAVLYIAALRACLKGGKEYAYS